MKKAELVKREPSSVVPMTESSAESLLAKAIERGADINTLERLLAMRKELMAEQARNAFFNALSGFQAKCPIIPKTKTAKIQSRTGGSYSYSYAPLEVIVKQVSPILCEWGLSFTIQTRLESEPLSIVAICTVHHCAGHSESSEFRAPIDQEARMNDMQKAASAQTYAKRYALCNALGILTGDDDDDGHGITSGGMSATQRADFEAAIDALVDRPSGEKLWGEIVQSCEQANDKQAYDDLKKRITAKINSLKAKP